MGDWTVGHEKQRERGSIHLLTTPPQHCDFPQKKHTLTPIFLVSHTALCHSFTSGLTLSSAEPGKHPEVVKIGARDISQPSEHAQSVFSSLALQPGQEVYLMAKTLSRTHHNFDCVGAFVQTCAHRHKRTNRITHF